MMSFSLKKNPLGFPWGLFRQFDYCFVCMLRSLLTQKKKPGTIPDGSIQD